MEELDYATLETTKPNYLNMLQQIDKLSSLPTNLNITEIETIFNNITENIDRILVPMVLQKRSIFLITTLNIIVRISAIDGSDLFISRQPFHSMFKKLNDLIDCIYNKKDDLPVIGSDILDTILLNLVKDNFIEICFQRLLSNETVTAEDCVETNEESLQEKSIEFHDIVAQYLAHAGYFAGRGVIRSNKEFSNNYTSLMISFQKFINNYLTNTNEYVSSRILSVAESILNLLWSLTDKLAIISIFIDIGYIQKIIQWIRTDIFASHIHVIGIPIVNTVYNLTRDKTALKQLRTEKAFDSLMKRKQLIYNENNSKLTRIYGWALIALATSDEQSEDDKKLILDTSEKLYELCKETDQKDDLIFGGYHLSELLELLDRAFTNTYVIKHMMEDKINEKSTAIQYFTELFLSLYGALLDPEPDELEKRAVKCLLRILLQISSYPEYLKQLVDNDRFCIIIESLANRPKRDDAKRIWCNIQQIMSTNERKEEMSSKIYISYDHTDEEFCKEFVKELRKRMTIPIWVDYEKVDLSDDMWEYVSPNIISATIVIILASTAYGESTDKFQELSYIISTNKSRDENKRLIVVATKPNFNFNRSWMKDLLHDETMISYENNIGHMVWNVWEQTGVLKKPRIKCLNWLFKIGRRETAHSNGFSTKILKSIPANDKVYFQKKSSQVDGSTTILLPSKTYSSQSIVTGLMTQTGSVSGSTWPKFSPNATWNPNGITIANRSIVGEGPTGIFVNTNNTIYIANKEKNTIVIWHEESVNPTKIIYGNFTQPTSIFVTSNGDIYIGDGEYRSGQVQKWIAETNIFVTIMNVSAQCAGLFADINNTLYCSMLFHHQVVKRSLNDSVMASNRVAAGTGSLGKASNQLNFPFGIFVDVNFDLYVADTSNDRVQLFQPGESNGITVAGETSLNPTVTLSSPTGIILDAEKYLFIVDQNRNRIVGSDLNGFRCLVGCHEVEGLQSNQLSEPFSFGFDRSGNMFVTDQWNHRIQKFLLIKDSYVVSFNQPKLCPTATWNPNGIIFANHSIVGHRPTAIFVNSNNTIYVANRENNTIVMWHEERVNLTKIIHGNFTQSNSLFVTLNGDIYIDDGEKNGQVQKWSAETNKFNIVMNVNSSCYGLFIDINNTLYCSMSNHHQVVKRSLDDVVITLNHVAAGTGIAGDHSNQLNNPRGIFVDVNLNLYVADCFNHRVQLFQLGQSNGITVANEYVSYELSFTVGFDCPSGIILDAEKNLFIVDQNKNRIIGSGLHGFRCLVGCDEVDSQSNQLSSPFSLSFDRYGNMLVTDQSNNQIQKFQYFEESCMNTSSAVQTVYTSKLTTNSSTYFLECFWPRSYYEAIQVNVRTSGRYTIISNSSMDTFGAIYKNYFNPSDPEKNQGVYDYNNCKPNQFKLPVDLETSVTYILVVTTWRSNETGAFTIFVSGPDIVTLKNISSPSAIEIPYPSAVQSNYSSAAQSNYSSELNTSSQTYSRNCREVNYYYQTIRMNVMETGYYALSSSSSMNTFGDIYKDDFNPMNPVENLLLQNYRSCAYRDFKLIVYLHTDTTYILVVTTFNPNFIGNFSILTSGPNNITLNPYSKYFVNY
ncbi:unnamed protein product [Adineta steineri]|uniref:TIR domain-containing protein n=1 Tax=Adineta steineri TaxID=433720 RepID=A0A819A925_9BILA|nr:unnamed protein product [Adineta steineri]CAF3778441.1 unnamed protein product [Adineta steineri]